MSRIVSAKKDKDFLTLEPEPTIIGLARFLARLGVEKFYGKLTIQLENGKIELIRQEQTFKPDDLRVL